MTPYTIGDLFIPVPLSNPHLRPCLADHTLNVKLMNVLVNFSDVKFADFREAYHVDSEQAKNSLPISASIWRSPEAQMRIDKGWNTATDIWSFGLCVSDPYSNVSAWDLVGSGD